MATRGADEEPRKRAQSKDGEARKAASKTDRTSTESKEKESRHRDDDRQESPAQQRKLSASKAAGLAARQVAELAGRDPESVTSLERTDQGWRVGVEVVETRRVPDSADILAVYETELDEEGELISYRRTQRYSRGSQE